MDAMAREEVERLMFVEQTKEQALEEFRQNPSEPSSLTKLGKTLVELAQFAEPEEAINLISEGITKLEESRLLDPKVADTLWWLGNAYTSKGFQSSNISDATVLFEKGGVAFREAIELDPSNETYKKALEICIKGPELHEEIQKQMALQHQIQSAGQSAGPPEPRQAGKKKNNNDFYYDVAGWAILGVGLAVWLTILASKSAASGPPGLR